MQKSQFAMLQKGVATFSKEPARFAIESQI
jgi:hypothetical protein